MPRPPDAERRQELFEAVLAAFAEGGVGGRSLREIAEAVGTSHRMLLHHFGSRDELLLAVVGEVERRQMVAMEDMPTADPAAGVAAMWASVSAPELRPFERLFFECYARGAAGEEPFARMHPAAVDDWLAAVDAVAPDGDPAMNRLGLAVMRGLLLDLVATGDDAGVGAAAAAFVDLLRR